MADDRPKNWMRSQSDDDLVAALAAEPERAQVGLARVIEATRRLKDSVERLNGSTTRLSWMMVALALVQVTIGIIQVCSSR